MKRRQRIAGQTGFALVELLVAVAVAGLAGSVLVGLVAFLDRNNAETTRRMREYEETLAVERVLRILLEGALPFVPGTSLRSGIVGDDQKLTVISMGPPILGLAQARPFTLRREARGSVSDLILVWVDEVGREQRELIAQDVVDFTFAYLPSTRASSAPLWKSWWRAEDGSLTAIRLALRFARAATSREVVIPIQADLPATCLRNPRQVGCIGEGVSR